MTAVAMTGSAPTPAADLPALVARLRAHPSIRSKLCIADAARALGLTPASPGAPGDDAALIPAAHGWDLLAGEGFIPAFVADDPWFAGWCGVMVNLSDIAAMGGRAVALVDQVWAPGAEAAAPLLRGLRDASEAYGVPLVGGHTNLSAAEPGLAVSVMGRAAAPIRGDAAKPGEALIALADHRGGFRNFDNWCAALDAPHARLRGDLDLLPQLSEAGLTRAGKDVSQGGLVGTALMLAEASGVGLSIDLSAVRPPEGVPLERWLRAFPSFGFLLTAAPADAPEILSRARARGLAADVIGAVTPGAELRLLHGPASALFWNHAAEPYLGLARPEGLHD
ncbi:sll0787 family AIR synthase-like protein [Rhodovulum sp. DZ06]|uniref:sll0787 family AIR synthase-like protein n=1 Tax=Rhodovulum sp. DZ06 TaxID=3425126 RepID=UPI003D35800B